VIDALGRELEADARIAYALVFGSQARGAAHAHSDVDVAVGFASGRQPDAFELGRLIATIESAVKRPVNLVVLDEAPPGLAYRIFRDGRPIVMRDEEALKARRVRAILEYLDFKPVEDLFARAVLRARAAHGR
jgi:predicted nucleotidyltransferase